MQGEVVKPIIANIEVTFDTGSDYDCKCLDGIKWQIDKCSVIDVYIDHVTASLEHISSYKIEGHILECA